MACVSNLGMVTNRLFQIQSWCSAPIELHRKTAKPLFAAGQLLVPSTEVQLGWGLHNRLPPSLGMDYYNYYYCVIVAHLSILLQCKLNHSFINRNVDAATIFRWPLGEVTSIVFFFTNPSWCAYKLQRDLETPTSTFNDNSNVSQGYENNLNIQREETAVKIAPSKLSFQQPLSPRPLMSRKVTVSWHRIMCMHVSMYICHTACPQLPHAYLRLGKWVGMPCPHVRFGCQGPVVDKQQLWIDR